MIVPNKESRDSGLLVVVQKWKGGDRNFAYEQWSICIVCQQNMVSIRFVTMAIGCLEHNYWERPFKPRSSFSQPILGINL